MILAIADEPKLLLQEYDVPPVAVTLIAVLVHVNKVDAVLLVIPAVGAVLFIVVVAEAEYTDPSQTMSVVEVTTVGALVILILISLKTF